MNEFENLIKNLDPSLIKKVEAFGKTEKGQSLLKAFGGNASSLMDKFNSLPEDKKKALLNKVSSDPSLIDKLKKL